MSLDCSALKRIHSVEDLNKFVLTSKAGEWVVYHFGRLTHDTIEGSSSSLPAANKLRLSILRERALDYFNAGFLYLLQQREGYAFYYLAKRSDKPAEKRDLSPSLSPSLTLVRNLEPA